MNHRATPKFWFYCRQLPEPIRSVADENLALLKRDRRHPSLRLKTIGRYWSVRVGRRHCALAVLDGDDFVWFWIGDHAEYDRLIADAY